MGCKIEGGLRARWAALVGEAFKVPSLPQLSLFPLKLQVHSLTFTRAKDSVPSSSVSATAPSRNSLER